MDAFNELRTVTRGGVPAPGSPEWGRAVDGHNPALRHDPAVILCAASRADVAAGVALAARRGLTVTVQCTGHGPAAPAHGGLLICTDRLTGMEIDPIARTVRVEAGVRWGQVISACARHGLAPLGMASVASVGVVGYTLGGGMGPFGRTQGFAADHVSALDIVGADGHERNVGPDHEADLYWAIRGGKFGLGIVTAMTLPLVRAPIVQASTLLYPREDIAEAMAAYAVWHTTLDEHSTSTAAIFRFPDEPRLPDAVRGQRLLQVDVLDLGEPEHARASVDQLCRMSAPATRTNGAFDPATWLHAQRPVPAGPSWSRGIVIDRLDPATTDTILATSGPETDAPWTVIEIRPMGGALGRDPAQPNAVNGRSDGVLINTIASLDPVSAAAPAAAHTVLAGQFDGRLRHTPLNFLGTVDVEHPLSSAWVPDVFARLDGIRRSYDPAGRFSSPGLLGTPVDSPPSSIGSQPAYGEARH